jgi:hypothetical protein
LLSASGAGGLGFYFVEAMGCSCQRDRTEYRDSLGLTGFTTLGFVLELLIVEKELFSGGENKVTSTIDALEHLVLKFHRGWLPSARLHAARAQT